MESILIFLGMQLVIIAMGITVWLIRSLIIKNKKSEALLTKQNDYLTHMYDTISMTERKIKEIDSKQLFQGDDDIGFFFTAIKEIQEQLSEYIKFMNK